MEMRYRCLDLTVVCAEGLKDVNLFTAMDVYVVVQLLGHGRRENKKRTHIDRKGGTNPRWNHRIKFTIDEPSLKNNPTLSVLFQLKSERIFRTDRIIGEVTIPMQELYDDWMGADNISSERVIDYQVRTSSGKPKGTLKISYKFGENYVNYQPPPPEDNYKRNGVYEPVTAFPSVAGTSMAYAPYPAAGMGYAAAYPGYGGYPQGPPAPPPGYPPAVAPAGYNGYAPTPVPPAGYGYPAPPIMQQQQPKKTKGKMGMGAGLGLGLGAGLLGGMLVGDMVSDVGEMAAYSDGYSDAMGDGGFDF